MRFLEKNWNSRYQDFSNKNSNKIWLEKSYFSEENENVQCKVGPPKKHFEECCPKAQKYKLQEVKTTLESSFSPSTIKD